MQAFPQAFILQMYKNLFTKQSGVKLFVSLVVEILLCEVESC